MTCRTLAGALGVIGMLTAGVLAPPATAAQGEDRGAALVGLARIQRDNGDLAGARGYFEQARALGPLPLGALTDYFWLVASEDFPLALALGRDILQTAPGTNDVRDRSITAAIALKREADVMELASGGRRAHPKSALWARRLAESYLRQGRAHEAADAYRIAASLDGAEPADRIGLAVALEAADRAAEAVAVWATIRPEALAGRIDWTTSRLRALAKGAPVEQSAPELEAWLQDHPSDAEMRALLVELRVRTGRPDLAAAAIGPLAAGPSGETWLRREAELSLASGNMAHAIEQLEALAARRPGATADRWRLADLLVRERRVDRARAVLSDLATPATGCSDRLFGLIEPLPEPASTDLMLTLARRQRCTGESIWTRRAIERAVASERHAEALAALQAWAPDSAPRRDLGRLEGQLLLWTGQPARAIPLLAGALAARPDDILTREALMDAYRATHKPKEAWKVAEPLVPVLTLSSERLRLLADAALEAGAPQHVAPILDRIADGGLAPADRTSLLGRALAAQGRHEEAQRLLETVDATSLNAAARQALAESAMATRLSRARGLHAAGRPAEALALVDDLTLTGEPAFFRAGLILTVKGAAEGAMALRTVALEPGAGVDVWLAWAAATSTMAERASVLERAVERFPNQPDLLRQLGRTQWVLGNADTARTTAAATLALVPDDEDAWFVLVDATAASRPRAELDAVLTTFEARLADSPAALVIRMAQRVAGLAAVQDDPRLARALAWLDAIESTPDLAPARELARARLHVAGTDWPPALAALDRALGANPRDTDALKLRAEVLSWTGRYDEALAASDAYRALVPNDVGARRLQARVAGWAGRYDESRRLYAGIIRDLPEFTVVSAELDAKDARFDGRWRAAITAGQRWLMLEPDSAEAGFDLADALSAVGYGREADARLRLLGQQGHRLADAAADRAAWNRRPAVLLTDARRDASGFSGLRLLDYREHGAGMVVGNGEKLRLTVEGFALEALGPDARRTGSRAQVSGRIRLANHLTIGVTAGASRFGSSAMTATGLVQAAWSPADFWTLVAGVDRERVLENVATVDAGLTGTGAFTALGRATLRSSVDLRASWHRLSDDNSRRRVSLTATRTIGLPGLRGIVWMEHLAYARSAVDYFTPAGFTRLDVGGEYTIQLAAPRFRHDRRREITIGYLVGTDDRRERYQQPTLRVAFEIVRGLAVDLAAGAIRSDVYDDQSLSVRLRLGGGAPVN